jgi:uncharacterized protein YukJ
MFKIEVEGESMPISNYSVLVGDPTSGKVVTGSSTHYQITMNATGGSFTVAVNIESVDGSEVLYAIHENFTPPDESALTALSPGMHSLPSTPDGLALDFVRTTIDGEPMISKAGMTLLPKVQIKGGGSKSPEDAMMHKARAAALKNAVITLLDMTIADKDGVIYAFGSAYSDSGKVDGIHDIHMNQGNPLKNHGADNGIWQDGALFIHLPAKQTWTAVFIAFQTESWQTDDQGNPA